MSGLYGYVMEGSRRRVSRPRPLPLRTPRDSMFEAILRNRILLLWLRYVNEPICVTKEPECRAAFPERDRVSRRFNSAQTMRNPSVNRIRITALEILISA